VLSSSQDSTDSDSRQPVPPLVDDEIIRRRRLICQNTLYTLHVGLTGRKVPRSRYNNFYHRISQTILCLNLDELPVFEVLYTNVSSPSNSQWPRSTTAECLHEEIIAVLKSIDTQESSGKDENLIGGFLRRDNTRLLFHELRAWLRSGFDSLAEWDRAVQFPERHV
ncbi:hypothetical protein BKA60DRAFT_281178, partial [Fusarium oxysporum]